MNLDIIFPWTSRRALEEFVVSDASWSAAELLEQLVGRGRRNHTFMDVLVMTVTHHLVGSVAEAARVLAYPAVWATLQQLVAGAFPNDTVRRLSPTAPSRDQYRRALQRLSDDLVLDAMERAARRSAALLAVDAGLFDPTRGDWTRPDVAHCVAADSTRLGGHTLVVIGNRTAPTERIVLDARIMSRADHQRGNAADMAVEMLAGLLDESGDILRDGIRAFVHDMALDSYGIEAVHRLGVLPIVKVPLQPDGKVRRGDLGMHNFTAPGGTKHALRVCAVNGAPAVALPDNSEALMTLRRLITYWQDREGSRTLYGCFEIPRSGDVPPALAGATAELRMTSTPSEERDPRTRRARILRAIPEGDPAVETMFKMRTAVEALLAHLKDSGSYPGSPTRSQLRFRMCVYQLLSIAAVSARRSPGTTAAAA